MKMTHTYTEFELIGDFMGIAVHSPVIYNIGEKKK